MLDLTIADNPPKSPFFKGGLSQIPPFLKGDQGNGVALIVVVYGMLKNSTLGDKYL